jgi:hypothetical protein
MTITGNSTRGLTALVVTLLLGPALLVTAQTDPPETPAPPSATPERDAPGPTTDAASTPARSVQIVDYAPPRRGAARDRISGATRAARALPRPRVLAPPHVAHTQRASPSLFFHLDGVPPEDSAIVLTVTAVDAAEPLAELTLPPPTSEGIHRVRLSDHDVALQSEVEYEWSIAVSLDPDDRARDLVDFGWLRRVPPSPSGARESVGALAAASLWYDALELASDRIDTAPENAELRAERNDLLAQGGLAAVIDWSSDPRSRQPQGLAR